MQARGQLMVEHRVIERMVSLFEDVIAKVGSDRPLDPRVLDAAVDFMRTYADRTHHGKEEGILFEELSARELSAADEQLMNELIAEHALGRETTAALARANLRYRDGDESAASDVVAELRTLCAFYPWHIKKEDKVFFPAARAYFSEAEDQEMLARFREFDRVMIHEKYKLVVGDLGHSLDLASE